MTVTSVNPLVVGAEPIENPSPPAGLVLVTSILGLLVALAVLSPDLVDLIRLRSRGGSSHL